MPSRDDEARNRGSLGVLPSVWKILRSAALLSCPRCGARPVFRGMFRMLDVCPGCGLVFEREPGYFIGAIYLNYGLTAALMIGGYFALERMTGIGPTGRLLAVGSVAVLVPILFFRHARMLWLGVDLWMDPPA